MGVNLWGASPVLPLARRVMVSIMNHRMGDQSRVARLVIQWLGSKRQRGDLKFVLNRLVRTRMLGVWEGPRATGPLSRCFVRRRFGVPNDSDLTIKLAFG